MDSDNWTDEEKEQLSHEADEQKIVLLEEFVEKRHEDFNKVEKQTDEINKQVQTADKNFQTAKDLDKQFTDLDTAKQDYQLTIVNKKTDISANQKHVAELQWADSLKDIVRDLDSKTTELSNISDRKQKLAAQMEISQKDYQAATAKNQELTAQKDIFDQKTVESKKLAVLIPDVERIEKLKQEIADQKPELATLQDKLSAQDKELQQVTEKIAAKKAQLTDSDTLQTQKDAITNEKDNFVETLTPLENHQLSAKKEVQRLQKHLNELKEKLQTKEKKLQQVQIDFQEKKVIVKP
jgi:Chromosome segregation ATPases